MIAVDILDIKALVLHLPGQGLGDIHGVVGGIIQNLDFKQFAWVIKSADRLDQSFDHIALIENWQLDSDLGPVYRGNIPIEFFLDLGILFQGLGAFEAIEYHEQIAVHTVGKQCYQGKQINYQPDVLNVVRHISIRSVNILMPDDAAKN